jgi:RHS repeat-associated protein
VYLYRGEQYDPDLCLYYLRARYFKPLSGRFLTRDPDAGQIKVPGTLHKYLYAGGNPVNAADPTGRSVIEEYSFLNSTQDKPLFQVSTGPTPVAMAVGECVAGIWAIALSDLAKFKGSLGETIGGVLIVKGCFGVIGGLLQPPPEPPIEPPSPPQPPPVEPPPPCLYDAYGCPVGGPPNPPRIYGPNGE